MSIWDQAINTRTVRLLRQGGKLLPDWIMSPGLGLRRAGRITIKSKDVAGAFIPVEDLEGRDVSVILASNLALQRNMVLPAAAKRKLTQIVEMELAQTLPGGLHSTEVRISGVKISADKKSMAVSTRILKSTLLEEITRLVYEQNGNLTRIDLSVADSKTINFLTKSISPAKKFWTTTAVIVPAIIIATSIFIQLDRLRSLETALIDEKDRVSELTKELSRRKSKVLDVQKSLDAVVELSNTLASQSRRVAAIEALTNDLPLDSYFTELEFFGDDIVMTGLSMGDVPNILIALQERKEMSNIYLDGPAVKDRTSGLSRFRIRGTQTSTAYNKGPSE